MVVLLGLVGCSHTPDLDNRFNREDYLAVYEQWQGVPYQLGGTSQRGIDCSAFMQQFHRELAFPIELPRTTKQQVKLGEKVSYAKRQAGDLVFFKTGRNVRHVGVLLDSDIFIHASTSRGVMQSTLSNPYWQSTFWQVRRLPDPL
ncbi:C40 family peptidase [Thaumasiovibrio sp. DFM-14]|uniref:C40 family peptidase n=1 Tax=Thaumasiovibrio sp. DFM-14 TaxID=3384792 RepID=UPI0039A23CAC